MTNGENGVRLFKLTQGKVAIVNSEDFEYLNQFKWCFHHGYAVRRTSRKLGFQRYFSMHKAIMGNKAVDHINGNGLDNRRSNLRYANTSENGANRKVSVNNTSKFKGVTLDGKKWKARIGVRNTRIYLGLHNTPEKAAIVYNLAAKKYFGEFARLNNI